MAENNLQRLLIEEFFSRKKGMRLPDLLQDEEFRGLPLEARREIMGLFNTQAGEQRTQTTMEGTSALMSILSGLMIGRGIGRAAEPLPPRPRTLEELAREYSKRLTVPKERVIIR